MQRMQQFLILVFLLCAFAPTLGFLPVPLSAQDASPEPLSKTKILRGLEVGVAQKLIATRVGEQGIDFAVTPEIEKELKNAGANEELIAAIRKAKVVSKVQPQMAALVITADADCTVDVNGTSFQMKAGEIKNVSAAVGDNIVQAVSKQDASVTWRQVVQVGSSEQKAVLIQLGQGDNVTPEAHTQNQGNHSSGNAAGQTKVNPRDGLTYVWILPGTFQMGCSPGDGECHDREKAAHSVTITKGFWMGQTPVTQAAYQRVVGTNPSHFQGDQLPVERVTWNEAKNYCSAVGMRLPTEAEWEYAAWAGSTASRYGEIDAIAWYGGNSGGETHSVGQKQPNAWKLYDMLGNVWQFTADWFDGNYYRHSPLQDPQGPSNGAGRGRRGGSWKVGPRDVRVSNRSVSVWGSRRDDVGFRCLGE